MDSGALMVLVVAGGVVAYLAYRNSQTSAYYAQWAKGANAQAANTSAYWQQYVAGLGSPSS